MQAKMSTAILAALETAADATRSVILNGVNRAETASIYLTGCQMGRTLSLIAVVYVGFLLLRIVFSILRFIFVYFLRPGKDLKSYGSWAIVTGATDGIGKAYCVELAKKGK